MIDKKILTIATAFFGISIGLFILLSTYVDNFLKFKNKVIIYTFLFIVTFTILALLGYHELFEDNIVLCIVFQLCFLIFGAFHAHFLYKDFIWTEQRKFFPDLGFTTFIWLLCLIPFTIVLAIVNGNGMHFWLAGSSLFFIIPLFLKKSFDVAAEIPEKLMKTWLYPHNTRMEDPTDEEMKDPLIISLLIDRKPGSEELTRFKIKAPRQIKIGKLFYFFTEDYNEQHPESPIEAYDKQGNPYSWLFYFKPKWQRFFKKNYIDPEVSVYKNGIRENSVIICERILLVVEEKASELRY